MATRRPLFIIGGKAMGLQVDADGNRIPQATTVLEILKDGCPHGLNEFLDAFIPRIGGVVHALQRKDYDIINLADRPNPAVYRWEETDPKRKAYLNGNDRHCIPGYRLQR